MKTALLLLSLFLSSAILIDFTGTPARLFTHPTLGQGAHPSSGYVMFQNRYCNGCGATSAANLPSNSTSYLIQWTYTVTVEKSSNSAPISGASVSITDTNSAVECSGTTNSQGAFSCLVNDTLYQAVSGTYSSPSFNPFELSISAAGCTTLNYGESFTATTSEIKQLSGC